MNFFSDQTIREYLQSHGYRDVTQTDIDKVRAYISQFVRRPEFDRSVRGLFCVDFKPGLIHLGAEVHEKSAVKLRDF
jgi:hypothetical protein